MLSIKKRVKSNVVIILVFLMVVMIKPKENEEWFIEAIEQPHIGNFSLPVSQQPGALFSFGQNIPNKGISQVFAYLNQVKGTRKNDIEFVPAFLYGVTDTFSIWAELPVIIKSKQNQLRSSGVSDLLVQLEGVVYAHENKTRIHTITFVGNMSFPTGSPTKQPSTGWGSPRFFLGFTAVHTDPTWYYFTSMGGFISTFYKNIKFGNQFLYQFGLGRNIAYKPDKWILNWLIELNGLYEQHSTLSGITQRNSGGNQVVLGPSLWFSTQRFIIQGGIAPVISEHLFGIQLKNSYLLSVYMGWDFAF